MDHKPVVAGDGPSSDLAQLTAQLRQCKSLTLATDVDLLKCMKSLSQKITKQSAQLVNDLDSLEKESTAACVTVENCVQDLNLMSSKQFMEQRIYDEEVGLKKEEVAVPPSAPSPSIDFVPSIKKALSHLLPALKAAQASQADLSQRSQLPYIIGTEEFAFSPTAGLTFPGTFESDGLVEPSLQEREPAIENLAGPVASVAEVTMVEREPAPTRPHPSEVEADRPQCRTDAEIGSPAVAHGNDPVHFEAVGSSAVEDEEGTDSPARDEPVTLPQPNFAALQKELAQRFQGPSAGSLGGPPSEPNHQTEPTKSAQRSADVDQRESEVKSTTLVPSTGALRSRNLFDSSSESDEDLFQGAESSSTKNVPSRLGHSTPTTGPWTSHLPPPLPPSASAEAVGRRRALFDATDSDDDDDDLFGGSTALASKKFPPTAEVPAAAEKSDARGAPEVAGSSARSTSHDVASPVRVASFFSDSDDDEDLLETMTTPKSQSKANGVLDRRPDTNSSTLFGDESSDAGIFVPPLLPSQPKDEVRAADEKKASLESSLFDEDSDEDIFGTSWHKLPKTAESQSASPTLKKDPPTSPRSTVTVARPSEEKNGAKKSALFDEDSDDELFSNSQKPQSKSDFRPISPAVAKTSLPDQLPSAGSTATVAAPSGDKKEVKESTLFDEDSDEEIFSKTSQKPKAIVESHSKSPVEATLRHQPPSSGSTATATVPSGEGNGLNKSVLDQPTSSSPDKNAADSFIGEKANFADSLTPSGSAGAAVVNRPGGECGAEKSSLFGEDEDEGVFDNNSWRKAPKTAESQSASPSAETDAPALAASAGTAAKPSLFLAASDASDSDEDLFRSDAGKSVAVQHGETSLEGRCREEDTDGNVCGSRPAPAAFSDSDSDEDLFGARVEKPTPVVPVVMPLPAAGAKKPKPLPMPRAAAKKSVAPLPAAAVEKSLSPPPVPAKKKVPAPGGADKPPSAGVAHASANLVAALKLSLANQPMGMFGGGGALPFRRQISAPPLGARAVAVEPEATIPERSIPERLIPSSDADSTLNCPARHRPRPPSSRRQPSRAHRRSMALDSVDSSSAVRIGEQEVVEAEVDGIPAVETVRIEGSAAETTGGELEESTESLASSNGSAVAKPAVIEDSAIPTVALVTSNDFLSRLEEIRFPVEEPTEPKRKPTISPPHLPLARDLLAELKSRKIPVQQAGKSRQETEKLTAQAADLANLKDFVAQLERKNGAMKEPMESKPGTQPSSTVLEKRDVKMEGSEQSILRNQFPAEESEPSTFPAAERQETPARPAVESMKIDLASPVSEKDGTEGEEPEPLSAAPLESEKSTVPAIEALDNSVHSVVKSVKSDSASPESENDGAGEEDPDKLDVVPPELDKSTLPAAEPLQKPIHSAAPQTIKPEVQLPATTLEERGVGGQSEKSTVPAVEAPVKSTVVEAESTERKLPEGKEAPKTTLANKKSTLFDTSDSSDDELFSGASKKLAPPSSALRNATAAPVAASLFGGDSDPDDDSLFGSRKTVATARPAAAKEAVGFAAFADSDDDDLFASRATHQPVVERPKAAAVQRSSGQTVTNDPLLGSRD